MQASLSIFENNFIHYTYVNIIKFPIFQTCKTTIFIKFTPLNSYLKERKIQNIFRPNKNQAGRQFTRSIGKLKGKKVNELSVGRGCIQDEKHWHSRFSLCASVGFIPLSPLETQSNSPVAISYCNQRVVAWLPAAGGDPTYSHGINI